MGVVNVLKNWTRERLERENGFYVGRRSYNVLMESPADPPELALTHPDIPKEGDAWSASIPIRVNKVTATDRSGPMIWIVEVEYTSSALLVQISDDPLQEPPEIEFDSVITEEEMEFDVSNPPKAIVNAVGDPIRGIFSEVSDGVLIYTRNEAAFSQAYAAQYRNKVNSGPFLGAGARQVKCSKIRARRANRNGFPYWIVTYVFYHRLPDWDARPLNAGRRGLYPVAGGGFKVMQIKLEDGSNAVDDVLLSPTGLVVLKPVQHNLEDARPFTFRRYHEIDFSPLNIQ